MTPQKKSAPKQIAKSNLVRSIEIINPDESREAPVERAITKAQILMPVMNDDQLSVLVSSTPQWAKKARQGPGGKMYTYVPHGYVTDTLNKAFGFDWDLIVDPISGNKMYALEIEEIVVLDKNRKPSGEIKVVRHVAVAGKLIIRVHDPKHPVNILATITKSGFGSQVWLPTMELGDALKAAKSDLLKVCAVQLGIALDLYYNEQAELNNWIEKETRKVEEVKQAEELKKVMSEEPKTAIMLLSRCQKDYGMSGDQLLKLIDVPDISALMAMDEDTISKSWELVKKQGG